MTLPTLDEYLRHWLKSASAHTSRDLARRLKPRGVTVAEWELLWTLYDEPDSPRAVATYLEIDKGAVSRLADRLAKKGFLARKAKKGDRKEARTILSLTPKGSALALELRALADEAETDLKRRLGSRTYMDLKRLLGAFVELPKE